jgi:hypothetical protein
MKRGGFAYGLALLGLVSCTVARLERSDHHKESEEGEGEGEGDKRHLR